MPSATLAAVPVEWGQAINRDGGGDAVVAAGLHI